MAARVAERDSDLPLTQASLTVAVAWSFTQLKIADVVKADAFPHLQRHAALAEQHPAFGKYPIE